MLNKVKTSKLKDELLQMCGGCEVCGYDFTPVLELHFMVPSRREEEKNLGNCCILCPTCRAIVNRVKSKKVLEKYGRDNIDECIRSRFNSEEIERLNSLWSHANRQNTKIGRDCIC